MSENIKKAYGFAIKSKVAAFTLVMSAFSVCRLVYDFFSLPMVEFFERLLHVYRVITHTIFDGLTFWIPFDFSSLSKDVIILYLLVGFTYQKIKIMQAEYRFHALTAYSINGWNDKPPPKKLTFWLRRTPGLLLHSIAWPIHLKQIILTPVLYEPKGHGPTAMMFGKRPAKGERYYNTYHGDIRLMMLFRLSAIFIATAIVVGVNYAFSI